EGRRRVAAGPGGPARFRRQVHRRARGPWPRGGPRRPAAAAQAAAARGREGRE
ncbi:unnamed protein product, partial [Prorocentrum cordatum]